MGDAHVSRPPGLAVWRVLAVLGILLGALFWWLTWMALLATARGPFYGFVDAGPYDHAWGGPSLAGAWIAHAGVWVAAVLVLAVMWWVLPVAAVAAAAGVLVIAWVEQI